MPMKINGTNRIQAVLPDSIMNEEIEKKQDAK